MHTEGFVTALVKVRDEMHNLNLKDYANWSVLCFMNHKAMNFEGPPAILSTDCLKGTTSSGVNSPCSRPSPRQPAVEFSALFI